MSQDNNWQQQVWQQPQPQPQQPTTPANDPWNATGAQTRQPAFTDGFAPAAPQQPAI